MNGSQESERRTPYENDLVQMEPVQMEPVGLEPFGMEPVGLEPFRKEPGDGEDDDDIELAAKHMVSQSNVETFRQDERQAYKRTKTIKVNTARENLF